VPLGTEHDPRFFFPNPRWPPIQDGRQISIRLPISLNNTPFLMPFFAEFLTSLATVDSLFFPEIQDGRHFKMAAK